MTATVPSFSVTYENLQLQGAGWLNTVDLQHIEKMQQSLDVLRKLVESGWKISVIENYSAGEGGGSALSGCLLTEDPDAAIAGLRAVLGERFELEALEVAQVTTELPGPERSWLDG